MYHTKGRNKFELNVVNPPTALNNAEYSIMA